ncbi:ABC transporter ATP-binding protein [Paenibacillus chitinolyticus]|uniref:ABC transporter ATP-binding protein n=1 Tax=Paenibacillus chitinolyticus TaxID=79263 RepID=A0A410X2S9_9BACL|nr:ABC transporter ATP-binding protein [Paenibacillus chitinolyticus]MCY9593828.1 ABC transporter ATP-binding protein [Paenibacillus chitinolyticus]MCY9599333.1 ABC transporter ATP-binding protein [Paenibacillus chitinolyticus]QAV20907.1 ABC transporter ATP-binding protein [Paenibacillus chitinolyticus]
MLNVEALSKRIDGRPVLEDVRFRLGQGSIAALVGRNGAGKTTLLRTLAGILEPDRGEVQWEGRSIHEHPDAKRNIVYVPDSLDMLGGYTAKECADLYRLAYPDFDPAYFADQLRRFHLPERKKIRTFSKGMKALIGLLLAFSSKASLILLDEPTNGLDSIVRKQVLSFLVEEVASGNTSVLISSHQLQELERIADTVIMIREGKLESASSLEETKGALHKLQVVFNGEPPGDFLSLPQVRVVSHVGRVYTLLLLQDDSVQTLQHLQHLNPLLVDRLSIQLEDVFEYRLGEGDEHAV